jgi:hypothetical protein
MVSLYLQLRSQCNLYFNMNYLHKDLGDDVIDSIQNVQEQQKPESNSW